MNIVKFLRHVFVAHEHNEYKPHLFRKTGVITFGIISIFLLGFSAGSSAVLHKTVLGASVAASVLIDLANESRLAYNEVPLVRNERLETAARMKGEDMAAKGYFAHNSPEGVTPWHWFKEAGYSFVYAGENLAINFTESRDIQKAWLESPLHRANLLDVHFREIGIATIDGVYENNKTIYVVQMFGTPALSDGAEVESSSLVRTATTTSGTLSKLASSTEAAVKGDVASSSQPLQEVYSSQDLVVAQHTDKEEGALYTNTTPYTKYAAWYERVIFGGTRYVDIAYHALMLLVAGSLLTMLISEYRKKHFKHIVYGICMIVALALLIVINTMFL